MKKIGIILFLFIGYAINLLADNVEFVAQAPESVIAGQQFRLVYTINQDAKDLRVPDMPDFEVLMGPSVSSQRSMQIVNGSVTHSYTITHTFILMGNTPGTYTIAPASIVVKGEKYTSKAVTIKVLPPDSQPQSTPSRGSNRTVSNAAYSQNSVSSNQIFVRQTLSKTKVYEQEAILLTYKLYSRVDLAQIGSAKFPEFKDFFVQEIDLDANRPWQMEHYDGLNYNTIILKQYLLFPQRSGQLDIEAGNIEAVVRIPTNQRSNNIFDNFFNSYQEVRKSLNIPSATIKVKPLPKGAPAGFNGAVGQFKLESSLSANSIQANEALTLRVKVSGKGNLKLVKVPTITFPADFDTYDPKTDNNIKAGINGVTGSKSVEYVAIPRFGGNFKIEPAKFVYFDPQAEEYKTLATHVYDVKVDGNAATDAPVVGNVVPGVNKEQIKNLGTDIRFIHSGGDALLRYYQVPFYGSTLYYLSYFVPLTLFVLLLLLLQKQAKENANLVRVKNKRANKLAKKRLKTAAMYMKKGEKDRFYEATVGALWGYIADKLNILPANLTKDNVQEELLKHGASDQLISEFLQTLSDCEFARYSPMVDESLSVENCYNRAAQLIGQLEDTLK